MANYRSPEKTVWIRTNTLSASARLFLEKGFSHATVKDISAASGVSVALIMKVMKSKEDILSELVAFVLESQFEAAAKFVEGTTDDPILFYAAETTMQLYMAESAESVRNLYAAAYSMPKTTAIIQETITDKLVQIFGAHLPHFTRDDFYLREIATGGIMRDFMAHPCNEMLTMDKKVAAFLEATLLVYRVPDEKIREAIEFVKQFDYPTLAQNAIDSILTRLDENIANGTIA